MKEIIPLSQEDNVMYTEIFYKYLQGDDSNHINDGLINVVHVEAMMDETKFKLHEDPEEVDKMIEEVDPEGTGFFALDNWIQLMTKKQNYIEEDLVRAFKVFDHDDVGTVKREELKVAFMTLIGKHVVSEAEIDAMFNEALPQTDNNGNMNYEELIKIMNNEPDPLALPDDIKL